VRHVARSLRDRLAPQARGCPCPHVARSLRDRLAPQARGCPCPHVARSLRDRLAPQARGCPCHLARTLAAGILPFARSEASALSPSGLRLPPTPARWHGQPLAVFSQFIEAPDGSPGVRTRDCTNRVPRPQLIPDPRRRAILALRTCSNVGGDQSSCVIVVPRLCPITTTPPDFRPGLLFDGTGSPSRMGRWSVSMPTCSCYHSRTCRDQGGSEPRGVGCEPCRSRR
jgi:hypothetical protein